MKSMKTPLKKVLKHCSNPHMTSLYTVASVTWTCERDFLFETPGKKIKMKRDADEWWGWEDKDLLKARDAYMRLPKGKINNDLWNLHEHINNFKTRSPVSWSVWVLRNTVQTNQSKDVLQSRPAADFWGALRRNLVWSLTLLEVLPLHTGLKQVMYCKY